MRKKRMNSELLMRNVSHFEGFHLHYVRHFSWVQRHFAPGDLVSVTELIHGDQIHICMDRSKTITVSSEEAFERGYVLNHTVERSNLERFKDWVLGNTAPLNPYWKAAYNSGIIDDLKSWKAVGEVQVIGVMVPVAGGNNYGLIHPGVVIVRILVDGVDQPYGSHLKGWAPLLMLGKYEEDRVKALVHGDEEFSGLRKHARKGIVIRHTKLRFNENGGALLGKMKNPDFKENL